MKLFGLRSLRTLSKVGKEAASGMQGDGSSEDVMPPSEDLDEMSFSRTPGRTALDHLPGVSRYPHRHDCMWLF